MLLLDGELAGHDALAHPMTVLDDLEQVAVVQRWSRRQVVEALTALHGVDVVTAMTVLADLGDPMTLNASSVPALGVEERSDEPPRAGRASPTPDPEVVAKPKRRQFTPHTHSTMTSINSCVLFLSTRGSSSFERPGGRGQLPTRGSQLR